MISGSHNKRAKYSLFNNSCEVTLHSIIAWPFNFNSFRDCYRQNVKISHFYLQGAAQKVFMSLCLYVHNFFSSDFLVGLGINVDFRHGVATSHDNGPPPVTSPSRLLSLVLGCTRISVSTLECIIT